LNWLPASLRKIAKIAEIAEIAKSGDCGSFGGSYTNSMQIGVMVQNFRPKQVVNFLTAVFNFHFLAISAILAIPLPGLDLPCYGGACFH
jgi:hypothetical protein